MTRWKVKVDIFLKRKRLMKAFFKFWVVFIALIFVSGSVNAQSGEGGISFGIRPTKANKDRPETFSYFSYELKPGDQIHDEALVINNGSQAITLKLYAADGNTAHNGGIGFTGQNEFSPGGSRGVKTWISLNGSEITLQPGQEISVPFTLNVPKDAAPGHHVAGLVVETPPTGSTSTNVNEGEAQFAVNVVNRAGVAVVIDVPGPHTPGLEIKGVSLKEQNALGATFALTVHNTGNIYTQADGFLMVTDTNSNPFINIPFHLDTILPGDTTIYYISSPIHISDSDYLLFVFLSLTNNGGSAELSRIEMKIRDGKPVNESFATESTPQPGNIDQVEPNSNLDLKSFIQEQWLLILIVGITIIILIISSIAFSKRRKKLLQSRNHQIDQT